jgi:hypothetical protein
MTIGPLLLTVFIITILSLYPFYLKKYKSNKYKGFWKYLGDRYKTPAKSLLYPLIYLIVSLILYYFFSN